MAGLVLAAALLAAASAGARAQAVEAQAAGPRTEPDLPQLPARAQVVSSLLDQAQRAYREHDYALARKYADAALASAPDDVGALRFSGLLALYARDFAAAVRHLSRAAKRSPNDADVLRWLADAQRGGRATAAAPAAVGPKTQRTGQAYSLAGGLLGAGAGLVLALVTAESSGGDAAPATGIMTVFAGSFAGATLGGGLSAPPEAKWSVVPAVVAAGGFATLGLLAGNNALERAERGDESARDLALHADLLLGSALAITGSAIGIAVWRDQEASRPDVQVRPALGRDFAGLRAAGRF